MFSSRVFKIQWTGRKFSKRNAENVKLMIKCKMCQVVTDIYVATRNKYSYVCTLYTGNLSP